jgi:hypothetical protein
MIIRRILGLIMLLTGLAILALSLAGAYYVGDVLDNMAQGVTNSLTLASQSLDTARGTLELARDTINDVYGGLDTAIGATANASRTIADSRPLIDNVAAVTTQEVPEAVEGIQAALPNMIQVASVIDRTLVTLSSVGIDRDIPLPFGGSIPLRFDLGIDYNPTIPFDESLRGFETSLEGLPESLRGLEDDLRATNENLTTLSADLLATSDNLTTINTRVGEMLPLLDEYTALIDQLNVTIAQIEGQIGDRLNTIRIGVIVLLLAIGLTQLAPIYLGWELITGRRMVREIEVVKVAPEIATPPAPLAWPPETPSNTADLMIEEAPAHQTDLPGEEHART